MTSVPCLLHHNGRDYGLQYVQATEADPIADRNERTSATIVRPLELDQRYYGIYTASTIENHFTEPADLGDYDADDTYRIDSILGIFTVNDDGPDLVWY